VPWFCSVFQSDQYDNIWTKYIVNDTKFVLAKNLFTISNNDLKSWPFPAPDVLDTFTTIRLVKSYNIHSDECYRMVILQTTVHRVDVYQQTVWLTPRFRSFLLDVFAGCSHVLRLNSFLLRQHDEWCLSECDLFVTTAFYSSLERHVKQLNWFDSGQESDWRYGDDKL